jgi:hypothetical protein
MIRDSESLASEILRGAEEIGAFVGLDQRKAFHGLQNGSIPATKEGRIWVTTKSRLRRHYNEERYEPSAKEAAARVPAGIKPVAKSKSRPAA